jgi:hypothetical protein
MIVYNANDEDAYVEAYVTALNYFLNRVSHLEGMDILLDSETPIFVKKIVSDHLHIKQY